MLIEIKAWMYEGGKINIQKLNEKNKNKTKVGTNQ